MHECSITQCFVRVKIILLGCTLGGASMHECSITQCFVRVKIILLGCTLGGTPMSTV